MAYIGNFPTSPGFRSLNFKQNTITKATRTQSGRSIRSSNATTLWSVSLQFPSMSLTEFRPIQAFIALTQGALNEFDVVLPTVSESQSINAGLFDGYVTVVGAHSAGDTTIQVETSGSIGTGNMLKAGDLVRFANHTKVYMCTTDINSDSAGFELNIQPALVEDLTNAEAVTTNNVPIRVAVVNDTQEFGYRTDGLIDYEIDVEEVL